MKSTISALFSKVDRPASSFYDACRIFIAPTRFAAGIPYKVHEAAANGLPSVVTPLLAGQLTWSHDSELLVAESAEQFAEQCLRLYRSPECGPDSKRRPECRQPGLLGRDIQSGNFFSGQTTSEYLRKLKRIAQKYLASRNSRLCSSPDRTLTHPSSCNPRR